MLVKLTRETNDWRYITEDGTLVAFERCTIGKYEGKLFMSVASETVEETHRVVTEQYLLEVTREVKFHDVPRTFGDGTVRILEEVEVDENQLNRTEVFFNMARPAMFSIDLGKSYPGYTFNRHWNGWECPYFTKEVAEEICKDFSFTYSFTDSDGNKQECRYYYKEETDTFYGFDDNTEYGEQEIGCPTEIQTPDGKIKVYDFGIAGWIWGEDK